MTAEDLELIKKFCEYAEDCEDIMEVGGMCPFFDIECEFEFYPKDWDITLIDSIFKQNKEFIEDYVENYY